MGLKKVTTEFIELFPANRYISSFLPKEEDAAIIRAISNMV
jgi:hypothetical protein